MDLRILSQTESLISHVLNDIKRYYTTEKHNSVTWPFTITSPNLDTDSGFQYEIRLWYVETFSRTRTSIVNFITNYFDLNKEVVSSLLQFIRQDFHFIGRFYPFSTYKTRSVHITKWIRREISTGVLFWQRW